MSLIICAHCGEERDLTTEGAFVRGIPGIQGVPFVCNECVGESYKPGHDSDELRESEAEWEETGCVVCGEPSNGYRLCGQCLTDEQREKEEDYWRSRYPEAPFSDDVIPSQREVA